MGDSRSTYNDWFRNIKNLVSRLRKEVLEDSPIDFAIIQHGRRPPVIRLIVENEFLNFKVKEIRTDSVKQVWIGKVVDIKENTNFIIYSKKEKSWLCVTGKVIVHRAEEKPSDFHGKAMMYVLDRSYLRDFRRYLISLDSQSEKNKQQKLDTFI